MDGTSITHNICILVEVQGILFGLCTRKHMSLLVWLFGTLHKIIANGLFDDDPHATVLEVEVQDIGLSLPLSDGVQC